MQKHKLTLLILILAVTTLACGLLSRSTPTPLPASVQQPTSSPTQTALPPTPEPTATARAESLPSPEPTYKEPVQLTGEIEITNELILAVYFYERFVMLEDLSGYVQRDYEYIQPLDAQILGPITIQEDGTPTYVLNLPAKPVSPAVDVDNDNQEDPGLQVWQVVMSANYMDDPFLGEDESGGWSGSYASARIDSENENEIIGGRLLIWSPDGSQEFPIGFGEDGLLFTQDDPVEPVLPGYTLVDLDEEPFSFTKDEILNVPLYEGDLSVNDYTEMSWAEAFKALHEKVSLEYPFTSLKNLDWDALYTQFAPLIEEAETQDDETAYFLALRDYAWSIPDGHIGLSFGEIGSQLFSEETEGGYGMAVTGLDDGSVVAMIVSPDGPADQAGISWGAEILEWDGLPISEALDQVVPWSMPFSTEEAKRIQQYRYLLRTIPGTQVEVTFKNPGAGSSETTTLSAVPESESFSATSVYAGYDFNALPVEYRFLPEGVGYIKINSLSEDINLIIRLWEWAIARMIDMDVPAIVIDLRQNSGGSPLGTLFASYFTDERIDISRSYYFSEKTGQFETYGPPSYTEPDDELNYNGQLGILVGPACASACEDVAYVLSQLDQTRVFGFYASSGMFGEVARGQYSLPGGYGFQAPTGMSQDMQGQIIIEGTGVLPDVRVPLNLDTVEAQYLDNRDVVLEYTLEVISQPLSAGIAPESPPKMGTVAQAQTALEAETPFLEDLALETYQEDQLSQAGMVYTYTIPLNTSQDLMWVYAWCTADQDSFDDNWSKIQLDFSINGQSVSQDDFALLEGEFNDNMCRVYYTVVSEFTVGEHILRTDITFTDSLNDGISAEDYPAGTHSYEYHVIIDR
jgi:C-terminal processing protease CtpA/Prc